jgi:hypothetical protein
VILPFWFLISDYDDFLADCISKLTLSIKAILRRIQGQIIFMIFYFGDLKTAMICEFNFTLRVPDCGASRYRAALRILIHILSRCQIVLLRVLLLIRLLLTFHHYTFDLGPQRRWGWTIVLCLVSPDFQPYWCFYLLFSLSGVDFPCFNGAD